MRAITPLYGDHSLRFATIEAGLISQLLEMIAPGQGIGLCQVGALDFERARSCFKLEESHVYLHSLLGGPLPASSHDGHADYQQAHFPCYRECIRRVKEATMEMMSSGETRQQQRRHAAQGAGGREASAEVMLGYESRAREEIRMEEVSEQEVEAGIGEYELVMEGKEEGEELEMVMRYRKEGMRRRERSG